jgi:hypothetical protein
MRQVNWVSPGWEVVRDDDSCRVCGKTMGKILGHAGTGSFYIEPGREVVGKDVFRLVADVKVCADCGCFTCSTTCRQKVGPGVHRDECRHRRTLHGVAVRFLPSGGGPLKGRPIAIFPFEKGDGASEAVARDAAEKFMKQFGDPELRSSWACWDVDFYWEPKDLGTISMSIGGANDCTHGPVR